MLKYSVIVPVNYNDGTEIPPELIQEFEFEVMVLEENSSPAPPLKK